ncbi:hypothetical protein AU476_39315 [Cupriavidus sp. UYMSc13B]|nr:hypothetical protein AU476_39315 [Cupriavidus sp. UYMSc13B]
MRRSLKFRAALATGLVVALIIFALAVVAQYYAYLSLRDLLQTQQDTLVKLVAEQLDEKFEGRAIVLRRLARQLAPMLDRSPEELRAFAVQAVSIPEAFNAVSLVWPDGELAFNSGTPLSQHISLAERDYVREIVRGASVAVSEPLVGKNNGAPGIVMAVGLRSSDGKLLAIVGLCPDGYEFPCYGRDYAFLTQTGLPKAFHRFSRLAMITPSPSCDASSCVSSARRCSA